jgi:hypothetical protein
LVSAELQTHVVCHNWLESKESHLELEFLGHFVQITHWCFVTDEFDLNLRRFERVFRLNIKVKAILDN